MKKENSDLDCLYLDKKQAVIKCVFLTYFLDKLCQKYGTPLDNSSTQFTEAFSWPKSISCGVKRVNSSDNNLTKQKRIVTPTN